MYNVDNLDKKHQLFGSEFIRLFCVKLSPFGDRYICFSCSVQKTINVRFCLNMHEVNHIIPKQILETLQAKTSMHNDLTLRVMLQTPSLFTTAIESEKYELIL